MRAPRLPALPRALLAIGLLLAAAGARAADPTPASAPRPAATRVAQAKAEAKPTWAELSPARRQALAPLTASWATLTEAHKRKWLAVADGFAGMPPPEQARLHTRMAEWAALSPQQRVRARQNYFEIQRVPAADKKAKWEAYQALPPEEKKKLGAAAARPSAPPTAAAIQPVPQQKLARVPKPKQDDSRAPRITVLPPPAATPDTTVPTGTPAVLP
jgi:hypothetical protein